MEFNRRFVLSLLIVAGFGVGAGYLLFGTESPPKPDVQIDQQQTISNFSLTETRTEDEIWRLYSDKAQRISGEIQLQNPRVVYTVKGETRAVVTSKNGTYQLSERLLVLRKNVVLTRMPQNQVLKTSILKWDRESGMLDTSARVRLEMPKGVLTATGMEVKLRKEIMRFLSDVEYSSR